MSSPRKQTRRSTKKPSPSASSGRVRYAVVGLGHIAQIAVLPAFKNARNSELVALISSDSKKLRTLSRRYRVPHTANYENFEVCLKEAEVDAVYIALPNSLHYEYTLRAARLGVHVLCEKPLAVTSDECLEMIEAAEENDVKLMTAYRLHFDPANLDAIADVKSGKIGDPRIFHSAFAFSVKDSKNIRVKAGLGGGPLHDIGVYCINAARYLFRSEPEEAFATFAHGKFPEVPEAMAVTLKFPRERLATFTISFNTEAVARLELLGTEGSLRLDPAYEYSEPLKRFLTKRGKTKVKTYRKVDQFGAEIAYFSKCILENTPVEPSGVEGWRDIVIIEAILESAERGERIQINLKEAGKRPDERLKIARPSVQPPPLVNAESPNS